ncbi:hypothetical protein ABZ738_23330 [Micromonospora sp. NPDC047793]|uniref:hypothetical protein n=1 Tax=Micromonospora sp. NPDC047793 TaxID=3154342 RepID=UPI0033F110D2
MAHGEAEHGCAQGEPCRPGSHEQPFPAKHHRRLIGLVHPGEAAPGRSAERPEEDSAPVRPRPVDPVVPRQRTGEAVVPEPVTGGCRSDLPGWAGGHRHGPVRPALRAVRRERPPRRWC